MGVFKNPLAVTTKNLRALQTMRGLDGQVIKNNFRPTQGIHGRPIYYHGLDLIKGKIVVRGSNIGIRDLKFPAHEQFLLTLPNCPGSPRPAPMWDSEGERSDSNLWRRRKSCTVIDSSSKTPSLSPPPSATYSSCSRLLSIVTGPQTFLLLLIFTLT